MKVANYCLELELFIPFGLFVLDDHYGDSSLILILVGRFFLGANKVMQISLGRSAADEGKPGIHKLSKVCVFKFKYKFEAI